MPEIAVRHPVKIKMDQQIDRAECHIQHRFTGDPGTQPQIPFQKRRQRPADGVFPGPSDPVARLRHTPDDRVQSPGLLLGIVNLPGLRQLRHRQTDTAEQMPVMFPLLEFRQTEPQQGDHRAAAEILGHDASTITRAVQNKYVRTPQGVLPMRFFFPSGGQRSSGQLAQVAIKNKIRQLIDNENPAAPLTDEEIARLLNKDGIEIGRRTVVKYRSAMDIPSASGRRRK